MGKWSLSAKYMHVTTVEKTSTTIKRNRRGCKASKWTTRNLILFFTESTPSYTAKQHQHIRRKKTQRPQNSGAKNISPSRKKKQVTVNTQVPVYQSIPFHPLPLPPQRQTKKKKEKKKKKKRKIRIPKLQNKKRKLCPVLPFRTLSTCASRYMSRKKRSQIKKSHTPSTLDIHVVRKAHRVSRIFLRIPPLYGRLD